jgi:hypothetical protein
MPEANPTIEEQMSARSEKAIALARTMFDAELKYSPESFADLDFILGHFCKQIPIEFSGQERDDFSTGVILKYGAYLGETLRRTHGGTWKEGVVPTLIIRRLVTIPFQVVAALIGGRTVRLGKQEVKTIVEYYAHLRHGVEGIRQRLCGTEPTVQALGAGISQDPQLAGVIVSWLENALTVAYSESSLLLDFGEESLKMVDTLLDEYKSSGKAEPDTAAISDHNLSTMFGLYFGECVRRAFGGRWITVSGPAGTNVPLLQMTSFSIQPLTAVKVRLEQGKEKSLWLAFQSVKSNVKPV